MAPHFHADEEHPDGGFVHSHHDDDAAGATPVHDHSRTQAVRG